MRNLLLALCSMLIFPLILSAQDTLQHQNTPDINRCVNLGNMLEAPNEGDWGLSVEESYMTTIAEAGFDSVRIPIRWSGHVDDNNIIDETFLNRIYEVVDWALSADLTVIINVHHYEAMMNNPEDEFENLVSLWEQIDSAFTVYPDTVVFELLNEPNNNLDYRLWNDYYPQLINLIRENNPTRVLIVGGDNWNSPDALENLVLPDDTDNLLLTFHFYDPFEFTHQGADWTVGSDDWLGTTFGSDEDYAFITDIFDDVDAWSEDNDVDVLLGEFGAYLRADLDSRILYTQAVRELAEERGMGWCYWEFGAGFGIYDTQAQAFNELYEALIPEQD